MAMRRGGDARPANRDRRSKEWSDADRICHPVRVLHVCDGRVDDSAVTLIEGVSSTVSASNVVACTHASVSHDTGLGRQCASDRVLLKPAGHVEERSDEFLDFVPLA